MNIRALSDPAGCDSAFPGCLLSNADINGDGAEDGLDIAQFVAALVGS